MGIALTEHLIVWASELIPQGASESNGRVHLPVVSSQRPGSWNLLFTFLLSLAEGYWQGTNSLACHVCPPWSSAKGSMTLGTEPPSNKSRRPVLGIS